VFSVRYELDSHILLNSASEFMFFLDLYTPKYFYRNDKRDLVGNIHNWKSGDVHSNNLLG
jgi:hypothetical protein